MSLANKIRRSDVTFDPPFGALADLSTIGASQVDLASISNARLANVATATIKGRATAGTGDPEDLSGAQATALLDVVSSGSKGLAPASGGGTTNFLRADATWAAPGGGSSSVTKGAGTSIAAGSDETWLVLSANSSDITGTGLTTVMSVTGVGVGRYKLTIQLIYQTSATTTGIDVAVNHTGTTTQWLMEHRFASTGGAAATAAASEAAASATGNLYEAQGNRTKNAIIGAGTVSVDAANTDLLITIEGFFVVSVTGSLEIKLAAEAAALVCRAMQGSNLQLLKLS